LTTCTKEEEGRLQRERESQERESKFYKFEGGERKLEKRERMLEEFEESEWNLEEREKGSGESEEVS
jgi:hypothetical protein